MTTSHTVTVDEDSAGYRLDKCLSMALPDISRARLQALIEAGAVIRTAPPTTSHSPLTTASYKVKLGETYALTIPELVTLDLTPSTTPLDIVYEDDELIIINKPAGMTVHPAAGTRGDTLVHALLNHCGASLSGIGGVARPGIVHRIDKETSGLLVVAKNDAAHQHLSAQLKERTLSRTYIAFVWMALNPRDGTIDAPIARNPRFRRQMGIVEGGKHAITHYHTLEAYHIRGNITPLASKVMCELETGRTHQIRVHMTHAKCPLMGDPVYGPPTATRLKRIHAAGYVLTEEALAVLQSFNRQALHAAQLTLIHPKTNEEMTFESPLPDDLVQLENSLLALTIKA
jgi:23S rRNA pseudouridine1911/1915/1917 synthase